MTGLVTKTSRLDGVLTRNRKHLLLDLALAALFPMALLLSGLAVGAELPSLSSAATKPVPTVAAIETPNAGV